MTEKGETFVSFKWMLVQTLTLVVAIVTIGILLLTAIGNKIDTGLLTRVSNEKFEERARALEKSDADLCKIMELYTNDKKTTNDRLGLIEQHLAILVGQPLKPKEYRSK